jgi:thiamine-monophosphate kinase
VSELGERALLARIRSRLGRAGGPSAGLVVGIGDDAAVVAPTRNAFQVLTTDALVEGVHFDRRWAAPADIGFRALAVNLSDLAAMGAVPRWALVSFLLRDQVSLEDVEGMADGLSELAIRHRVHVIGGNLARTSGPMVIDVTAVGEARPRHVLSRSGGRAGDALFVSGTIGSAAAGLEMLAAEARDGDAGRARDETCATRFLRPEPRVRLGHAIANAGAATAAIDLSDGLGAAVAELASASGCGVEIDAEALPIDPAARAWWEHAGADAVSTAMRSDDYELLFAAGKKQGGPLRHARSRVSQPPVTRIGVLTKDRRSFVLLRDGRREELPAGFEQWGK